MADPAPKGPFAIDSLAWEPWSEGEKFGGKVRVLSSTRAPERPMKIGIGIEELAPGKQSCPFHYHMVEEEHLFMLEGEATLRLGDQRLTMKAGDFVSFRAGDPLGHCMVNEGTKPCRYMVIGDHQPDEVCVYPDSNKIMVRALSRVLPEDVFDLAATKDYWAGET